MKVLPVGTECSIRKDRHEEDNSRFSQFCGSAYGSIRYKKSKKLEEFSAELFSATRTERILSVLGVGMQIASRIILKFAVNKKIITLQRSSVSHLRENVHITSSMETVNQLTRNMPILFFDVLLSMRLSTVLVINQLMHKFLFYKKFIIYHDIIYMI